MRQGEAEHFLGKISTVTAIFLRSWLVNFVLYVISSVLYLVIHIYFYPRVLKKYFDMIFRCFEVFFSLQCGFMVVSMVASVLTNQLADGNVEFHYIMVYPIP